MSELISKNNHARSFRWELLATVSALALLTNVIASPEAEARDADRDRPTVWIELGARLERNDGIGSPFAPAFTQLQPTPAPFETASPIDVQHNPRYSKGAQAAITLAPADPAEASPDGESSIATHREMSTPSRSAAVR